MLILKVLLLGKKEYESKCKAFSCFPEFSLSIEPCYVLALGLRNVIFVFGVDPSLGHRSNLVLFHVFFIDFNSVYILSKVKLWKIKSCSSSVTIVLDSCQMQTLALKPMQWKYQMNQLLRNQRG